MDETGANRIEKKSLAVHDGKRPLFALSSFAAKQLFVSQPAVTAQIKLFEDNCGLKLF
jgi:hypothetical protein